MGSLWARPKMINRKIPVTEWTRYVHKLGTKSNLVLENLALLDSNNQIIPLTMIPLSDAHCMLSWSYCLSNKLEKEVRIVQLNLTKFFKKTHIFIQDALWITDDCYLFHLSFGFYTFFVRKNRAIDARRRGWGGRCIGPPRQVFKKLVNKNAIKPKIGDYPLVIFLRKCLTPLGKNLSYPPPLVFQPVCIYE
jgi:hypothetical protein